jgi:hypothetical protein
MADSVNVEVTGKSKYEIAHLIAFNILNAEHGGVATAVKSAGGRKVYLTAVYEAMEVLSGIRPK